MVANDLVWAMVVLIRGTKRTCQYCIFRFIHSISSLEERRIHFRGGL